MNILTECNTAALVVEILAGKTVVFPTETSYGLGCDATNQKAADAIFKIKGRPSDKPLLVVVPTVEMAKEYLEWNDTINTIATKYWPGPVTVVGRAKNNALAEGVRGKDGTVAVRVTANEFLQSITQKMGKPLVATSANVTDMGDMYNSQAVIEQFKDREYQPDIVVNYGELEKRKPTTIVRAVDNELTILRQGEIIISI